MDLTTIIGLIIGAVLIVFVGIGPSKLGNFWDLPPFLISEPARRPRPPDGQSCFMHSAQRPRGHAQRFVSILTNQQRFEKYA